MRIVELMELVSVLAEKRANGARIGLVCGCFDILHLGHIELFRYARRHVDILVVGMDTDMSIRRSKGPSRPIHDLRTRLQQVIELRSVNYAFAMEGEITFGDSGSIDAWRKLLRTLRPDVLITNREADQYCEEKESLASELGIQILIQERKREFSSTRVEQLYLESQ